MTPQSAPSAKGHASGEDVAFVEEGRLLHDVETYLRPDDTEHVSRVLTYAHKLHSKLESPRDEGRPPQHQQRSRGHGHWDYAYGVAVAQTLADAIHIDAISLAAVLLYQAVEAGLATLDDIRNELGEEFGADVAQTVQNIERFDTLQRSGEELRRSAQADAEGEELSRVIRRRQGRNRKIHTETIRKMFVAMSEDPRVVVFMIADQLRRMRVVRQTADLWRQRAASPTATAAASDPALGAQPPEEPPTLPWTLEECRLVAQDTREIYAPLAARLGMGRVEGELEDLAFAVLEPDAYTWLSEAVAEYTQERGSYIERVCGLLRDEMRGIGLETEVTGRSKHLYSIYKKVQRTGSNDITNLYDILAFRIIVETVEQCYLALGHVHALWKPKDGRIKDFIANPKPNGYQSLHTTVFCLDDRLAEIQIRTRDMHQLAEYGVATHWSYKKVGDRIVNEIEAKSLRKSLQSWVQQVKDWQQEFEVSAPGTVDRAVDVAKADVLNEHIFVFTPAGDVKELPAGATPLDFAYRIHTDVGNQVAGIRVTSGDANGRLVKKLVPLDYELKSGDVVEVIKRKDAHPTRDWLHVARTKTARDHIRKYLEAHERDIDMQIGLERLDRELRSLGLRKGYEDLAEEDITWLTEALDQPDIEALLVAIGGDKMRISKVLPKLRERLLPAPSPEHEPAEPTPAAPARETQERASANVAGVSGILTQLANCCAPLPGDELMGFISRGRGVVIHRADCATLAHLLQRQPGRGVAVDWPKLDGQHTFQAPIVIEAMDRTGLLSDVTGVITGMKINMIRVSTVTKPVQRKAIITATLELQRPDQLNAVIKELQQVESVESVERKKINQDRGRHART